MNSDLMNVLGVLIAFITVMLIFSIAITSLVQATQGLLRFRARNLQNSLANILQRVQHDGSTDSPKKNAISLLNRSDASLLFSVFDPESRASRFFGPQVSWMHPDDLDRELRKNELELDDNQMAAVSDKFRQTQKSMKKVFLRRIRMTTLLWAFVIAFYYQLSTPQLFHDFSTDPDLQKQAEAIALELIAKSNQAAAAQSSTSGEEVTTSSGDADPTQDEETKSYFQLDPWSSGIAFYYNPPTEQGKPLDCTEMNKELEKCKFKFVNIEWSNLIGVLITVMLLSLGAPFWFDMLKQVVNLKDTLSKDPESQDDGGTAQHATESGLNDGKIALLQERLLATSNSVLKASLQKEINDLRLVRADRLSPP